MKNGTALSQFLKSHTTPELSKLLEALAEAFKVISRTVQNAGLNDITGITGSTNVQGEEVQKLDDFTNNLLMDYLRMCGVCAGYLSEENDGIETLNENGKYIVSLDPLDGSSNIDVVAPIGTIFSVHERLSSAGAVNEKDFLQPGTACVAAGYAIYGSSTVLLYTTGSGTHGFTLHSELHEFQLSHFNIQTPAKGKIYSLNQGNIGKFDGGLVRFIDWCSASHKETSRPYSLRYIGSMVADMHRTFLKGGIFIYPGTAKEPKGKLRLLYECIPMAFLMEQAGGSATTGNVRILEVQPEELHERSAIYIGSKGTVETVTEFLNTAIESR